MYTAAWISSLELIGATRSYTHFQCSRLRYQIRHEIFDGMLLLKRVTGPAPNEIQLLKIKTTKTEG